MIFSIRRPNPLACLLTILASSPAMAETMAQSFQVVKGKTSTSLTVSLTVLSPCLNSRHAGSAACRHMFIERTVESAKSLDAGNGGIVADALMEKVLIRTIDYY